MIIKFDKEKLENILADFYNLTGTPISVFDAEFKNIAFYPFKMQEYCAKIREDEIRRQNCLRSDIEACKKCETLRKSMTYTCHAKITETVTPVLYENIIVGYIIFGQYRPCKPQPNDGFDKYIERYGLDREEMKEKYMRLPVLSEKRINSAINILKLCISKMWLEEMIKLEDNIFMTNIEVFISENLSLPLTADYLCRQFFISKKQLYRLFNKNFGTTVKKYIFNKKIEYAKRLLNSTDLSVARIAEEAGFGDYNNFIQQFRKNTGSTPLQFRKYRNG